MTINSARLLFYALLLSTLATPALATTVRVDFAIGVQTPQSVYIELFDQQAPITVANFLNYIENETERRYDNTFVHRLDKNFVIQLGGYTFDPAIDSFEATGVSHIPEDSSIDNEFSTDRLNTRGTIAMAKIAGDLNSAKSEWFFNLKDNTDLDTATNQFTVFGRVLGTGMETVDAIANLDIQVVSTQSTFPGTTRPITFTQLPVTPADQAGFITLDNLVKLLRVVENPPAAFSLGNNSPGFNRVDFGPVTIGTGPNTRDLTIQFSGAAPIGTGTAENSGNAAFLITENTCSNRLINPFQACTVSVQFDPGSVGDQQADFTIRSNLPENTVITLSGSGVRSSTPILSVTPAGDIEFPRVLPGETERLERVIKNLGEGLLVPGIPTITGTDANAFSTPADQNTCTGETLALEETCTIAIVFSGDSDGAKTATLQIADPASDQTFQATLTGLVAPPEPNIEVSNLIDMGEAVVNRTRSRSFGIRSTGEIALTVTSINVIGADAALFTTDGTCVREINIGIGCRETLSFSPVLVMDSIDASIRINSDDPDSPVLEIPITASALIDRDGIADAIEDLAPNGGDGNSDGISDALQAHVASLPDANGDYITLETAADQTLVGVAAVDNPSPDNTPRIEASTLDFKQGFFTFIIEDIPVGGASTVTIHLPRDSTANTYFKYGITPRSPFLASWYQFNFNGETGAEFLDDRVVLHFVDGKFGDSDLTANGRIVDPGGPATITLANNAGGGGGGGGCSLRITDHQLHAPLPMGLIALVTGLFLIWLRRRAFAISELSEAN